jgi:hypothetical protein
MGNWGIAKTATPKEKLKSEFADYINGLNSAGELNYSTYCELFDYTFQLMDRIYNLGKSESEGK